MPTPPRTLPAPAGEYDPPRVEQSLSPEELEREAHYAGAASEEA
jgi:hypothetical protein